MGGIGAQLLDLKLKNVWLDSQMEHFCFAIVLMIGIC
jgi:hypothetical protein